VYKLSEFQSQQGFQVVIQTIESNRGFVEYPHACFSPEEIKWAYHPFASDKAYQVLTMRRY
jgi:hypothetical protein